MHIYFLGGRGKGEGVRKGEKQKIRDV